MVLPTTHKLPFKSLLYQWNGINNSHIIVKEVYTLRIKHLKNYYWNNKMTSNVNKMNMGIHLMWCEIPITITAYSEQDT